MKRGIIKQDINFLDKPLWFQNVRHDGLGFTWSDNVGYEYRSGYKLPDKVDILILFYLMLKSQTNDYKIKIEVSRREILVGCGLPSRNNKYYERVEDSLKRWENVSIEFSGTFYDNKEYLTIGFGIIDDYEINKTNRKVTVWLNEKWMLKIKNSNFFRYLNFEYYKLLKRPVSRRLYEILSTKGYDGKKWSVRLTRLGSKLPIFKRKSKKSKEETLYASDVLVAIKPAINEINRLAKTPDINEKAKFLPGDVFKIEYYVTGKRQERVVHFTKELIVSKKVESENISDYTKSSVIEEAKNPKERKNSSNKLPKIIEISEKDKAILASLIDPKSIEKEEKYEEEKAKKLKQEQLEILLGLLRKKSSNLEKTIKQWYEKKGYDYVYWNIVYSNKHSSSNYSTYLKKSLEEDWGIEESEKAKDEIAQRERLAKEQRRREEEESIRIAQKEQAKKERGVFFYELETLDNGIKVALWRESESEVPEGKFRRESLIKIVYCGKIFNHFSEKGREFCEGLKNDFHLPFELEAPHS